MKNNGLCGYLIIIWRSTNNPTPYIIDETARTKTPAPKPCIIHVSNIIYNESMDQITKAFIAIVKSMCKDMLQTLYSICVNK